MPQPIVFWKWITSNCIALVTQTAVYHWHMDGKETPTKMFDRLQNLGECQIINYRADQSETWLTLVGIAPKDGQVVGSTQLHSVQRGVSQYIEAHAAAFAQYLMEGASKQSTLFVFAQKNAAGAKLFIAEVAKGDEDKSFPKISTDISFPPDMVGDFPVGVQVSEKFDMVFVVTKFGFLHLYYLGNGMLIYRNRISSDTIFLTTHQKSTDGFIGVNRKGQVLSVSIDEANIVPYISATFNDVSLARRLAAKNNLSGADELFKTEFVRLFSQGSLKEAAILAAKSPGVCPLFFSFLHQSHT